jgi:hypothetical protein
MEYYFLDLQDVKRGKQSDLEYYYDFDPHEAQIKAEWLITDEDLVAYYQDYGYEKDDDDYGAVYAI